MQWRPAVLLLAAASAAASAEPLKCGVAHAFSDCPACFATAVNTGALDFFWNWGTSPKIDTTGLSSDVVSAMYEHFVPMVYDAGASRQNTDYSFLANGTHVMGYNEPDMFGPYCVDWGQLYPNSNATESWNCTPGTFSAATSSGWAPLFDPTSAALLWQGSVNNMTQLPHPHGISHIVSPSMAMSALGDGTACIGVDPSAKDAPITHCNGWLKVFKEHTLKLPCTDLAGAVTNCWDVIDSIQIHGYARKADDILGKIEQYRQVFAEDFAGANGRKRKTLWLTEVAAASNDAAFVEQFVDDLLSATNGLQNRQKYDYVEKVSWFTEYSFGSFSTGNYIPAKGEMWVSSLFQPFGELTDVGKRYFGLCSGKAIPPLRQSKLPRAAARQPAVAVGAPTDTQPLKCGVAHAFSDCPACLSTAVKTGALDFFWNWNTEPQMDTNGLPDDVVAAIHNKFVPMIYDGSTSQQNTNYSFLGQGTHVMGYNEPDMFGPYCVGFWNLTKWGCPPGVFRTATSSGWAPLFDPSSGAQHWQWTVNNMTVQPHLQGVGRIVSPSMAMNADGDGHLCIGVDPAADGAPITHCNGWLKVFKEYTLKLPCTDLSGKLTNCWDVIDSIQIHAYARTAGEVLAKIDKYHEVFAEDFAGANGRTRKTLWLTEVAAASNDATFVAKFIDDLLSPTSGLTNRQKYSYVEKVSWFHEYSFGSFTTGNYTPAVNENWVSSLFEPFGALTLPGQRYFAHCAGSP